jgi:hypothetical protein
MPAVSPSAHAGLLLAAISVLTAYDLPSPSANAVLAATGASRTTAYKARSRVEALLPDLLPPPGRPAAPSPPPPPDTAELHRQVVAFLFDHPGAVAGSPERRQYSDRFRLFVIELSETYSEIPLSTLAQATCLPLPTLKEWLRSQRPQVAPPETLAAVHSPGTALVETVLAACKTWDRDFRAFCERVSFEPADPVRPTALRGHPVRPRGPGPEAPGSRPGGRRDARRVRDVLPRRAMGRRRR